ncbi:MAG: dephospho-CoA kinase [Planctomycetes bacterium]|nr:dephospho-CoA kinase [Planctomycetota bacterium]
MPSQKTSKSQSKPVVGILGGLCSGKTTVAKMLEEEGFCRIDADMLGHEVLKRREVRTRLVKIFGDQILGDAGEIDREKLGQIAFQSRDDLEKLNEIVHPIILRKIKNQIRETNKPVVLDAALLIETDLHREQCTDLVFINSPLEERRQRAKKQRNWESEELAKRESLQIDPAQKKELADYIVENSGNERALRRAVKQLSNQLKQKLNC